MSSSDIAVSVRNVSKSYTIAHNDEKHSTLAESLLHRLKNPLKAPQSETFWALRDVSFDIKRGDVVGIIGRNGAGKSTLLKILSRITEPTQGEVHMRGRVGSLLEVGTGFHPELTGRENIFLNGAILGMTKGEIRKRFDEIVDFAEVEKFLDTPVKRYSSGMYVRLAFAVAAHLNPEILIVDEVLAVGDAQFQKKCLGKMQEVTKSGNRTILFVSHNMAAVQSLCSRAILMAAGQLQKFSSVSEIVAENAKMLLVSSSRDLRTHNQRQGSGRVKFTRLSFELANGQPIEAATTGKPLIVAMEYESNELTSLTGARASLCISDSTGQPLILCSSELTSNNHEPWPQSGTIRCRIPTLPLAGSEYFLSPYLEVAGVTEDHLTNACVLPVEDGDFYGTGRLFPDGWRGKSVLIAHDWHVTA